MIEYFYEGITREGEKIKGYYEAQDETDLRIYLRSKKIRPIKIKEKNLINKNKKTNKNFKKITEEEKYIFIQEFLVMLKSDLTIIQALEVLAKDGPSSNLMQLSSSIINYMQNGSTFSQAISRFSNYFDNMFLNIVASGELRGNLAELLQNWQNFKLEEDKINKIVNKTISYPFIISSIFMLSFLIISFGITPIFEKIYRAYNVKLPTVLLTLSTINDIISYNVSVILFIILLVVFLFTYFFFKSNKKNIFFNLLLSVPIFSGFFKKIYSLKTITTIHAVLKCNISLKRALELSAERINNYRYELVLLKAAEASKKKEPIASFLEESKLFRTMTAQIISVGENMNKLGEMLEELKTFYFKELENICNKISSLIEPLLLIVGGIIIGAILMSYFIPIISILEKIK